jgi:hypothetical protein
MPRTFLIFGDIGGGRLRAAVQESDDLEIEDALDDLAEAMNQLKLAIGSTADAATGPESA